MQMFGSQAYTAGQNIQNSGYSAKNEKEESVWQKLTKVTNQK